MGCIALVRCVGVTLWFGWGVCGIRMQAEALVPRPAYGHQAGLSLFNSKVDARSNKHKTLTLIRNLTANYLTGNLTHTKLSLRKAQPTFH